MQAPAQSLLQGGWWRLGWRGAAAPRGPPWGCCCCKEVFVHAGKGGEGPPNVGSSKVGRNLHGRNLWGEPRGEEPGVGQGKGAHCALCKKL
jgi:hypothetical protein